MTTTITIQTAGHRVELKTKKRYSNPIDGPSEAETTDVMEMNRSRVVHIHSDMDIVGIRELSNDDNPLPQVEPTE